MVQSASDKIRNMHIRADDLFAEIPNLTEQELWQEASAKVYDFYRDFKSLPRKLSEDDQALYNELKDKVIRLKLGGKLSADSTADGVNSEMRSFIEVNRLYHKCFPQYTALEEDGDNKILLPVEIGGKLQNLSWDALTKEPIVDTAGNQTGLRFVTSDATAFETNTDLELTDDYCFMRGRVVQHNQKYAEQLKPYVIAPEKERPKVPTLEIWTSSKIDKEGNPVSIYHSNHTFFVLAHPDGRRISVGQEWPTENYDWGDMMSPLGRLTGKGSWISPASHPYLPHDYKLTKACVCLSEEGFNGFIADIEADRRNPNHSVAVLEGNCTTRIIELLKKHENIEVNADLDLTSLICLSVLPMGLVQSFLDFRDRIANSMPSWLCKTLCFFPPYYVANLILGLIVIFLSLFNHGGGWPDMNIFTLLFMPWRLNNHHPLRLRKFLEERLDGDGYLKVNK